MKKIFSSRPLGKTGENARRIASAIVLEKAGLALAKLLGPEAAANLTAKSFSNGQLTLAASHGVWSQEVELRRPEIIRAVNRELDQNLIKTIRLR